MDFISLLLVIIGAINWGSIGIFGFDIVGALFGGQGSIISRVIFTLVGLAGLWCITLLFRDKKNMEDVKIAPTAKRDLKSFLQLVYN